VVCAARTEVEAADGLPGTIHQTAAAITDAGGEAIAVRCDVGREADIEELIERTVTRFGRLDVLVNNAMAPTRGLFADTTPAMWDESIATNLRSLFVICRAALPHLGVDGGSIINVSSGAADHASAAVMPPGFLVYSVVKAAMERFSTALAGEVTGMGVAVNALRPGAVKTEHAARELGPDYDWSGWTEPEAVVPAVAYLANQRGDGLTGRVLDVSTFGSRWP
jgi:NAD(P)-dependent dehydrogenase (short-subunit alcohol dehydrogenase family)